MDLLEREDDLAVLESSLIDAGRGRGSLVLVSGEAGVGKTMLVRRFSELHEKDACILWGTCDDLSTPRTLGPFLDVAMRVDERLTEVVTSGSRRDVFTAVFELLAADRSLPTVLIIEDAHWADGATLDVVKFLGRRIERIGAIVVVTARQEEIGHGHPLSSVIGDLPRPAVRRIELEPLSRGCVEDLAEHHGVSADHLFSVTKGNPFLVFETLLVSEGRVPSTVRDAVSARASRLTGPARAVAEMVAVVPGQTERWLLEALPSFESSGLDECREKALIEFDVGAVRYRHELVRSAMEESLTPHTRRAMNDLVWRALAANGADVARIVHHARRAEDAEAVAHYAPMAGRRASGAGAHREALAHFRIAVGHASVLAPEERAQLFTDYAVECYLASEALEGLEAANESLRLWRQLANPLGEGDVLRWISRLHWWLGHGDQAIEAGLAAVEALSTVPRSKQLAMAYSNLAQVHMLAQHADEAEAWACKAIDTARELDDANTLSHALNNLGSSQLRRGDMSGYGMLEESLAIALRERYDDHAGRAYANLIWTALDVRDYEKAESYIEEGLAFAANRELAGTRYYITAERSRCRFDRGLWAEAEHDARWVLDQPEEPGITTMPALAVIARLQVRRGDPEAARTLDEAWALAEPTGELQRVAPVAMAKAEYAWLRRDRGGIEQAVSDAYPLGIRVGQPWISDELAFWAWRAGCDAMAISASETPFALQIRGEWAAAADAWSRLGCPYERAVALADSHEPSPMLQAVEILDRLGARPAAANVRIDLRRMGVRGIPRGPRRTTRSHPAGLTQRQVDVLGLLAEGMTNAEIAERLVISPKTVDHHVSAILLRLDVPSRREAAVRARALGVV